MSSKAKRIVRRCVWCGTDFAVPANSINTRILTSVCGPCQKEATTKLGITISTLQQKLERLICAAVLDDEETTHAFEKVSDTVWVEWLRKAMGPALALAVDGIPLVLPDCPRADASDVVTAYCHKTGLSRRKLAGQIGVTEAVLGNLAKGRPVSWSHRLQIATALGVDPVACGYDAEGDGTACAASDGEGCTG